MTDKDRGAPERVGPYARQVMEARGLRSDAIPEYTPEEATASRTELAEYASRTRPTGVAPPRVPAKFVDVRFAKTAPRPEVDGFDAALSAARTWVSAVAAGRHSLVALIGPKGTSKSHLAWCAAWALYEDHRIRAGCYRWYGLVDDLRYGKAEVAADGSAREVPAHAVRRRWWAEPVVILDECRPTSGTDFDAMELAKFTMDRYDERRSALITCNWSDLSSLMGEPAADRYAQFTLNGPSYRGRGG